MISLLAVMGLMLSVVNVMVIILQAMVDGNRWIPKEISGTTATENPNADWPLLTYGNNDNNNRKSTFWLYERKYLRLRNVEVSYDFPQTWTRKFFVSNLRLGFVGQNLLTWAPFKMWDPEGTREDGSNYPINKTFSCYLRNKLLIILEKTDHVKN